MAWISMRRSMPCVLRHLGDAANDPDFKPMDPAARWPHHARRWLAVLLLVGAVTAFSVAHGDASGPSAHEEPSWRAPCLIAALGDARLRSPVPREFCAP